MAYNSALVNLAMLFLLMAVGYLCGKFHIISQKGADEMTALLMQVTLPCTILSSMLREYDAQLLKSAGLTIVLTFAAVLLSVGVAWLLCRLLRVPQGSRGMWVLLAAFSNNGFMGFPVVYAIYGSEGLFLAAAYNMAFNILMYSIGVKLVCSDSDMQSRISLKKLLLTNINFAIVIGLVLFVSRIPIPAAVHTFIDYLGDTTTPMSMIIVGVSLTREPVKALFRDKHAATAALTRLILMPLLLLALFRLLPFLPADSLIPPVMVVITAMPAAAASVLLARQYDGNLTLAGRGVFATCLLCILTLPLILLLL